MKEMESVVLEVQEEIEVRQEKSLRPQSFEEYVGQEKVKNYLSMSLQAAKKRGEAIDHCLFYGPPGLGKTSLAILIAKEMGAKLHTISGPGIDKKGDLAAILTSLQQGDILFIDEIHRLQSVIEEMLYPAMEDFSIDVLIGSGPGAKSIKIDLPRFTLIGATTRSGLLTTPLRDRFGIIERLEFYTVSELAKIISRSAKILESPINQEACEEIASRSRGTPRIANRLLRRVRDFAEVHNEKEVTKKIAAKALDLLHIDHLGLDRMDRLYLDSLVKTFEGGPAGIEAICAAISEDRDTLEDLVEPFLLQSGLITRTPRGRMLTETGAKHMNFEKPGQLQL